MHFNISKVLDHRKDISNFVDHRKDISTEKEALADLLASSGDHFPGSDFHPADRKTWMSELGPDRLRINQIVWPGTHDSATNDIGVPLVTRPFAECQTRSIYDQLVLGTRVLDVRVEKGRHICHGILQSYSVDVVLDGVKRFLSEAESEIVILEIRTEYGHEDPPEFDKYLVEQLGDLLIHHDDAVFGKTVAEVLPKRIICVWKPRNSPAPAAGSPLWSAGYLRDNWIDTDLPKTKFDSNMKHLGEQPPSAARKYFYRVEHTVTPKPENPVVKMVDNEIRPFARLFIAQTFAQGFADRLQVFSTDFIDEDFVDACAGMTQARVEGQGIS
ncbi:unnamed protein product [Musa acuminata subsp. malaccensis]|uniref:(wild Malaysian banana) hypothetical protein n=1 Tax=Musa acuminata subsp. malaccensis TaxID=214687 RepID=A0A804KM10_MUSAM|nr:PREDICTED: uncharacterized protein LOC103998544 [Musa acuminata subsp. malaccensis]CAG1836007.1 unnamed protein product [Musa acuminata subsp. malaccensis]